MELIRYISLISAIVALTAGYLLCWLFLPRLIRMIEKSAFVVKNFEDNLVPNSAGIIFLLLFPAIAFLFSGFRLLNIDPGKVSAVVFIALSAGVLGLLDDVWGDHACKGFRGHFGALLRRGELTTGGVKAVFSLLFAMVFSLMILKTTPGAGYISGWPLYILWFVDVLLVILVINTINLFDLRPGRACKVFFLALLPLFIFSARRMEFSLVFPILGILLHYLPYDLKTRAMLGDTGANFLGAFLGAMFAIMYTLTGKIAVILVCLTLNLLAEKYSFSKFIDKTPVLRMIDMWGRKKD